jgi:hypothetical protein
LENQSVDDWKDDVLFGFDVGAQVLRPGIEPIIYRDLFLFRKLASFLNGISIQKLGCNTELIVDEFGEKLLEELDYTLVCLPCLTYSLLCFPLSSPSLVFSMFPCLLVSTTLLWCSAWILSLFIILYLGQFNGFCITEAFLARLQEARNIEDFYQNFKDDPSVKIPLVYRDLSGPQVLVMEWIDGVRCTNPEVNFLP